VREISDAFAIDTRRAGNRFISTVIRRMRAASGAVYRCERVIRAVGLLAARKPRFCHIESLSGRSIAARGAPLNNRQFARKGCERRNGLDSIDPIDALFSPFLREGSKDGRHNRWPISMIESATAGGVS